MYNIITISRQFGSGGRSIAKSVAEELGYAYYDKELIKEVAEKTGFDPRYIEEAGEYAKSRSIFSYALPFTGSGHGAVGAGGMSTSDFLWVMQRKVILELAEKGPCVIVGRCADYILRERTDALHVFVHADEAFRADRIVRLYGESEKSPEARLKDKDGRRAVNYKYYTGREWGKAEFYDLSINSGKLGIENCVSVIAGFAKHNG
ncbi:MAG: cytidylate kinase-like family protein [Clostridia bacterium]|nr:cytidylate kinase-like family protein [Clostridia bacterium]